MRRIGIINYTPMWEPLRETLRKLGYVEGQNIAFEYRSAASATELSTGAAELVSIPVDVIVTYGTPTTLAAKQATTTIPIVMVGTGDPVQSGLTPSLARPGGNVTGNTILGPEVVAKRVQIFKEAVPTLSRVALLWNPENVSNAHNLVELQAAVPRMGLSLLSVQVSSVNEFKGAFAAMMLGHPDGMVITCRRAPPAPHRTDCQFPREKPTAGNVPSAGERGLRGLHVVWREPARLVPAWCLIRAQDFARHQAGRSACRAADEIRPGDQSQDRQGARPRGAFDAARPR
jgi:hypothetical protein